tara:strand:+ start:513 stop:1232 length:720 start_codon:yes stop_codon:yes gene_type:complete
MIKVNQVYQTVLYILNKEQRGYVTPEEFNSLATQSQLDIFEKYFEDLNQALRMPPNDSEYANRVKTVQEKIDLFESSEVLGSTKTLSANVHRLGTLQYTETGKLPQELEQMTTHDLLLAQRSKLTAPTKSFPAFSIQGKVINISPSTISGDDVNVFFVKKPEDPIWGYTLGSVGNFIYNSNAYDATTEPNGSRDFEIPSIDQTELILKILMYAGVIIRDPSIVQTAASMVAQEDQNEKT